MTSVLQKLKKKPSSGLKNKLRTPHMFQRRGVEWLVGHAGAGLFVDPGGGKSAIVLRALLALKDSKVFKHALIVTPLRVAYEVWPVEASEWRGTEWDRVNELKIEILHGNHKEAAWQREADIYVINFDGLRWLFSDMQKFRAMRLDTLIVDESTKLKHTRTQRFRLLRPLFAKFARRWILTGTPNPNGYMDLFGQIFCIDLGRALGQFITHYRMQYFTPLDPFGWGWALQEGADKKIQKAIAPYIFRLDASDYIKMPKVVNNVVRVTLPAKVQEVYEELEVTLITMIQGHVITVANSGALVTKCAQVANGGLFHMSTDKNEWGQRTWTDLHTEKIAAVQEIIDELQGSPCMVVYDYEHDLARLKKALGEKTPHIGGDVAPKQSKAISDAWNRGEIKVLLVHPQTVAHGLNMQKGPAQHIIWHSLTWNYEDYDQLIRRLRRQGSPHTKIFVHHIVAQHTIDEAKMAALRRKERVQTGFLQALREYAEARKPK